MTEVDYFHCLSKKDYKQFNMCLTIGIPCDNKENLLQNMDVKILSKYGLWSGKVIMLRIYLSKIWTNMGLLIEVKHKVIDRHSLGGKNRCFLNNL